MADKFTIHRVTKKSKLIKTILAYGPTEEDAWEMFNDQAIFLNYNDLTTFKCVRNGE
jgi:hypothetical protein